MVDPEKPASKIDGPPESPTTARELDFDDEDLPTSPKPSRPATSGTTPRVTQTAAIPEVAPSQPPRPLNPRLEAENTLKEAFPAIDAAVVRAVLTASGGQVEPAFHALLGMSDPDSQQEPAEPAPPPQPPRPTPSPRPQGGLSQLEADEQYARQLAEHYNGAAAYGAPPRSSSREQRGAPRGAKPTKEMGLKPNELYDDREHSFLDDDLPIIRENIRKGFLETQSKVNSFIISLKKKIDGEDEEDPPRQPPRNGSSYAPGTLQQQYDGRRSGDIGRRSGDHSRYDADPQVLGDDFAALQMRDDTASARRGTRPLANPDLFKPTPSAPRQSSSDRQVSFQDGPPEEIGDPHRGAPDPIKRPTSSTGRSKWQPLSAVEPSPVADHDPFSLGDSDDEGERKKDGKVNGPEGVKNTVAETTPSSAASTEKKPVERPS